MKKTALSQKYWLGFSVITLVLVGIFGMIIMTILQSSPKQTSQQDQSTITTSASNTTTSSPSNSTPNKTSITPAITGGGNWIFDVPFNELISHIVTQQVSSTDRGVIQEWIDAMQSGSLVGPWSSIIAVASSSDGITFTKLGDTGVTTASVPEAVIDHQGRVWLFFADHDTSLLQKVANGEAVDFPAGVGGLGAAVSTDGGRTFTRVDLIIENIVPGIAVDPDITVAADGTFQLYYLGVPALDLAPDSPDPARSNTHTIYLATSADDDLSTWKQQGIAWTGPRGGADPAVYKTSDATSYIIAGGEGISTNDGQTFTETSAIILPQTRNPQGGGGCGQPDVLAIDGGYRLFCSQMGAIKSMFSTDGLTWAMEDGVRFQGGADPSVIRLSNGTYLMYYKTKENP